MKINDYENDYENRLIILGLISRKIKDKSRKGIWLIILTLVSRMIEDKSIGKEYDRIISIKENQRLRNRESIDYSYSIAKDKR